MKKKKIALSLILVLLIISLWFNGTILQKQTGLKEWEESTYNQLVSKLYMGGQLLGYETPWYEQAKASLEIGEAAVVLNQWIVYSEKTGKKVGIHEKEVAKYLRYSADVLIDADNQTENDVAKVEKYVKSVADMLRLQLGENGTIGDITEENKEEIFKELYELIQV
ncbi:hypothetical protein [Mangrovibacillus cuniculi]|uniref:Uncharacterized protein n=1 Tax=Mangrovibacillus cuniculi TaxID=2593652 RepID=A0A7S8C9H9_9BACI|nr:hypothetical protein [Mangrovibacillus cuniculi]QPC45854.1 hypothetical protein G8O30_02220 [Mangrovibacillus cuniculi]